jgi:hypothetical protein
VRPLYQQALPSAFLARTGIASMHRLLLVAALLVAILCPGVRAYAQAGTFIVSDGAFPWSDRAGIWSLTNVPPSLSGVGPLPQQNCSSRSLEIAGAPPSIVLGVSQNDTTAFEQKFPAAKASGETIGVKNPAGTVITYGIFTYASPPAEIKGTGLFGAGLLLLGFDASKYKPAAAASTAIQLPPKADFDLYLLMGQSNMVGRDTSLNASQVDDPKILALNPAGQWVVAHEPMHAGGSGMGPGISFAKTMRLSNPNVMIGLIPCAVGGTPLSRWVKGGDLYERAVDRAQIAKKDGVLCGVLWHQGESDTTDATNANTYGARLKQMLADLRVDLGIPDLPIVIGELGEYLTSAGYPYISTVRAAIAAVPGEVPNTAIAPSNGLVDKGDHLHFSAASQIEFGKRYAAAMLKLQSARTTGAGR